MLGLQIESVINKSMRLAARDTVCSHRQYSQKTRNCGTEENNLILLKFLLLQNPGVSSHWLTIVNSTSPLKRNLALWPYSWLNWQFGDLARKWSSRCCVLQLSASRCRQPRGNQGSQIQCTLNSAAFPVAAHRSTNPIWDNEKTARQPAIGQRQHLNSQWHPPSSAWLWY